MKTVQMLLGEIVGLFIDDGSLAVAILILVGVAAAIARVGEAQAWVSGAVLFFGCILVLVENVARKARNS